MGGIVRIGTRKSPLAMIQSRMMASLIEAHNPHVRIELVPVVTSGDKMSKQNKPLPDGKGLFIKELEEMLIEKSIDLAVHSMKDMPAKMPAGLTIGALSERADPRDVLLIRGMDTNDGNREAVSCLKQGAIVGTSSQRRAKQITMLRPDVEVKSLQGNVGTRIKKLNDGQYDAIVLAAAGLCRMGISHGIPMDVARMVPAAGQGIIGIQAREDDPVIEMIRCIDHPESRICLAAERAFTQGMGTGCNDPVGAYASIIGERLRMITFIFDGDEGQIREHFSDISGWGNVLHHRINSKAVSMAAQFGTRIATEYGAFDPVVKGAE